MILYKVIQLNLVLDIGLEFYQIVLKFFIS